MDSTREDHQRRVDEHLSAEKKQLEWDNYFCDIADVVRQKSKDPRTHCGSVIVGPDKGIRSTGYNGFPMGVGDFAERWERPTKYDYVAHSERNAIDLAARTGTSTDGCTLYVVAPIPVCNECAKSIIQSGIKKVILRKLQNDSPNPNPMWEQVSKITKEMFTEAGVEYEMI